RSRRLSYALINSVPTTGPSVAVARDRAMATGRMPGIIDRLASVLPRLTFHYAEDTVMPSVIPFDRQPQPTLGNPQKGGALQKKDDSQNQVDPQKPKPKLAPDSGTDA